MTPATASDPASLTAIAVANAFALAVAVYIAANISGGHANPAVTFAMAVGGHITIPMAVFYWVAQMLASVMACLVLKTITVGQHIPVHSIPNEMTGFGASILEVAAQLLLERGNAVRIKLCDKLHDCFHIIQIPIIKIDMDHPYH